MKLTLVATAVLTCCGMAQAAGPANADAGVAGQAPATSEQGAPAKKKMKMKAKKPMQMDAPMKTPMAKPGMMKGDVKHDAAMKEGAMKDMMKAEEKKMPPMPAAAPAEK